MRPVLSLTKVRRLAKSEGLAMSRLAMDVSELNANC